MKKIIVSFLAVFAVQFAWASETNSQTIVEQTDASQTYDAYVLESEVPHFPQDLLRVGIDGRALLKVIVDEQGNIAEAKVLSSSFPQFGKSALRAVEKWMFEPGKLEGVPVAQVLIIPFFFEIEGLNKAPEGAIVAGI